jgi:hypothetical protein
MRYYDGLLLVDYSYTGVAMLVMYMVVYYMLYAIYVCSTSTIASSYSRWPVLQPCILLPYHTTALTAGVVLLVRYNMKLLTL